MGSMKRMLNLAFLVVGVVSAVGDDEVVEEEDAHQLASLFHAFCEAVVVDAGSWVVAWVVVAECDHRGVFMMACFIITLTSTAVSLMPP